MSTKPETDQLTPTERAAGKAAKIRQQAFLAATATGNLPAQIQLAREQARDLLMTSGLDAEDELTHVAALAGECKRTAGEDWEGQCNHLKAAYALGIAIGQLVHPDVFRIGGTR
jgi:hypothetical protein